MKKIYLVTFLLFITSCFSYSVNAKKHRKQVENVKKESNLPFKLSIQEKNEGYEILFDGTSMEQWISNTDEYKLEEGCIVMRTYRRRV